MAAEYRESGAGLNLRLQILNVPKDLAVIPSEPGNSLDCAGIMASDETLPATDDSGEAPEGDERVLKIPVTMAGTRLDKALAQLMPDQSRSTLQRWLKEGRVVIGDEAARTRQTLLGGEHVVVAIPPPVDTRILPEPIEIDVVFEDDEILVIDKPAGLVVHPGAGNETGTLANGLINHDASLTALPRAGIVHRLDKDTTGVMVVAKTESARLSLVEQLSLRSVSRKYCAVVCGRVISGDTVDEPIGRDPGDRRKMAVAFNGKEAISHYRVTTRFREHTTLEVSLESGRTHQIRVHMAFAGFPVFGDQTYGRRLAIPTGADAATRQVMSAFKRQALHAGRLELKHPGDGSTRVFERPPHEDMRNLMLALERDTEIND